MENTIMTEDFDAVRCVSEPELRRLLGISDMTFTRMKARGDAPPKTQISPGRIGYRVADIKAWLDRRRQPLTTEDAA
jgi:predicted DNA-binding transcriptional regulator AlpA